MMMQPFSRRDKKKSQIMKQKIVLHVPINEEKSRAMAMTVASKIKGVTNVSITKERDHMVVIGEGVDSVDLANSLRKRLQFADIMSVKSVSPTSVMDESDNDEFEMQTRFSCPTHECQKAIF